ncbi:hypothetical protein HG535_0A03680 [Zygotorulaspora mrakii]|uniref:Ubiquitin carboxyl-terminal hydrolase n=1 Tax=Zygotorulaspora mrakii TaxID=42260 RepID=A0A7H9AXB6_ZYGMR|nr:uncharacterized protein HG535_0A03680 [Zygotorulaspora mrakii]QLG70429.1 hypothetical protein HG535_0A03680 [Zygotorulaspora mrakii]
MSRAVLEDLIIPSVISKDECLFCYASVYNESNDSQIPTHSLYICLTTFQPVCEKHLPFHSQVIKEYASRDTLYYLNISKVKKLVPEDSNKDDDGNMNKKIKLHVVEKSEDELYNTFWMLIKYDADQLTSEQMYSCSDSNVPAVTREKVEQILRTKSQEMVDQTASWELSINSCIHTRNFKVPEGPSKKLVEKCFDCDLAQNLWLCLVCGNIGCGREQIGIEGHSHAKKHYENNPEHGLAVKLGSLSSTSCDVYCYACDEEVKFDDQSVFIQTLIKYGIDIGSKEANEKTLVELQVEQNMNWDFQMTDSKGQGLKKMMASKEYGCGLINLGNSCYMNSVLQCLLNGGVKHYSLDLIGHDFPIAVVYPEKNVECQVIKLNNAMCLEPNIYPDGIRPKSFKRCVAQSHQEFSSGKQQDALEFLTYLIDFLDEKLLKKMSSNPNDLLKFVFEDRLECKRCGKVKYTSQQASSIQIPLMENDQPQNLLDRLRDYTSGEELEFRCPVTGEMGTAVKSVGFRTFPDTLVINPIRIKLENWTPVKTNNELVMPGLEDIRDTLDISQFKSFGFNPSTEKLLPETDDSANSFEANPACVAQLSEMGFGANAITKALYVTGNQETEVAMNWLFQHMDDPGLNEQFSPPSKTNEKDSSHQVNPELLENMMSMGLDPKLCRKALILNHGDVNASVEWVFSNMDDNGELEEEPTTSENPDSEVTYGYPEAAPYELTGVVCHKGNSVQSGHYVAFIRKEVEGKQTWILYNDEKIVLASEESLNEIKKNGYLYFYSRI